ncbi:MAG: tRNA pseudouridine(38-40) synthase TruA [Aestuariivita sp.]|nr:tRNA pseudouridine(38-40) synthase TruA [Aestuariivita sp.]MCY4203530.1 tRNA pseudouridine(38-40) synthase TruA [Aestuariivita sp.]MCY4288112.1 tRNA pseudouridine(38-40) synthase TruA [Aestuariivita sp.]MCY4346320.1 tRNA pseudouridine(38-40) synthase TruA [Aestuariivita sp.]
MTRFAFKIEYHGAPFSGWQRQLNEPSVQRAIEVALEKIVVGSHVVIVAGRTDSGVHALGQVAHCDLETTLSPHRLMAAMNYHLRPNPIAILDCAPVADDWHARFSAIERRYLYRILMRRSPATLSRGLVWQVRKRLDIVAMQKAAKYLVGYHDFTTFRSSTCQADSPLRTLDALHIEAVTGLAGDELHIHAKARSFLHKQVRSLVGTLERVGAGAWLPEDARTALEAHDRSACGPVSPPTGLYLAQVRYLADPFDMNNRGSE